MDFVRKAFILLRDPLRKVCVTACVCVRSRIGCGTLSNIEQGGKTT